MEIIIYLCHSDPLRQLKQARRLKILFSLTAKFEDSCSADDGTTAVDGQTLIRACVSNRLGAADHQAPGHQGVAQVQAQWDRCAIHKPSARQRAGQTDKNTANRR